MSIEYNDPPKVECSHEEIESMPSSIPRLGYKFSVWCKECKEKLGHIWWEEYESLNFRLVSDDELLSINFEKPTKEFVEMKILWELIND